MATDVALPPGFVLESEPTQGGLPPGFVLEQAPSKPMKTVPGEKRRELIVRTGRRIGRALAEDKSAGGSLKTAMLGATSGLFGVGDRIVREEFKRRFPSWSDEELSLAVREAMRTAFETNPAAYGAGYIGSAVIPGGGAVKAVHGAAKARNAAKGAQIADNAVEALTKGVLASAAGGAGATALNTAIAEERAPTASELALGATIGAGVRAGAAGLRSLTQRGSTVLGAALESIPSTRALGKRIQDSRVTRELAQIIPDVEQLPQRAQQITEATGVEPAFVEILPETSAARLGGLVGTPSIRASQAMQDRIEQLITGRGERLAQQIGAPDVAPSSKAEMLRADEAMRAADEAQMRAADIRASGAEQRSDIMQQAADATMRASDAREAAAQARRAAQAARRDEAARLDAEKLARAENIARLKAAKDARLAKIEGIGQRYVAGRTQTLAEEAQEPLREFAARLSRLPTGGKEATAASEELLRDQASKKFGELIRKQTIELTPDEVRKMLSPQILPLLPRSPNQPGTSLFRGRLAEAEEAGQGLTVRANDLDALRQDLVAAAAQGGLRAGHGAGARFIRNILGSRIPGYNEASAEIAARAQRAEGLRLGERVLASGQTADRLSVIQTSVASPAAREGFTLAARRVIQNIAKSPTEVVRVAKRLADDDELYEKLSLALDENELAGLRRAAKDFVEASEAMRVGTAEAKARAASVMRKARRVLQQRIQRASLEKAKLRPDPSPPGLATAQSDEAEALKDVAAAKSEYRQRRKQAVAVARTTKQRAAAAAAEATSKRSEAAQYRQRAKAIETGRGVVIGEASEDVAAAMNAMTPENKRLAELSARAAMAAMAREGPQRSAQLARKLAEDTTLQKNLQLVLGDQAGKLSAAAKAELERARSAATASYAARSGARLANIDKKTVSAIADIGILSGTTSRPFLISSLRRMYERAMNIPPRVALRMANRTTQPEGAAAVAKTLMDYGIKEAQVRQVYNAAAIGLAQVASTSSSLEIKE